MVLDFEAARSSAFEYLSSINSLFVLNTSQKKELNFSEYIEVWSVKAEITLPNNDAKEITLHICFPKDFPLAIPKVYLSPIDNKWIRYIPHLNVEGLICTLDEESIYLDTDQPGNIVKTTLNNALRIIEEGLAKNNTTDFADEFIAYWEESYNKQDKVILGVSMLESDFLPPSNAIKLLSLSSDYAGYSIILHNDSAEFLKFKSFLKEYKYSFDELEAIYLGELPDLQPPFDATNKDVLEIVQRHFSGLNSQITKFINTNSYPKYILFSITNGQQRIFFGWRILRLITERNGYRNGSLSAMDVLNKFQKNDPVQRIKFHQFTRNRLHMRTEGTTQRNSGIKIAAAGLGSIGSNLLHFLLPLGVEKCVLIDDDILTMENTPRHLLGMNFIRQYKVDAIKVFLENNNPLLNITAIRKSIINVITSNVATLNECDYIFLAIGKDNIEEYVFNALKEGVLQKPVFFLWVEPYLLGAHCLLIQPGHELNFKDLYPGGLFIHNIISEAEYKDAARQFTFKEAGCQSSYIPYGMKSIMLFLSNLIPEIYKVIDSSNSKNLHIAWKGDEQLQKSLGIQLSRLGNTLQSNTLSVKEL